MQERGLRERETELGKVEKSYFVGRLRTAL